MLSFRRLKYWAPFSLDALGIVTLLGAEEMKNSIGRLVRSTWLEYMPLLGAYMIAGDRFRDTIGNFEAYIISSGVKPQGLAPWFTHFLQYQEFEAVSSYIEAEIAREEPRRRLHLSSVALSITSCGFLLALTVKMFDWWGCANAIAIIASVFVRSILVNANRTAIDDAITNLLGCYGRCEHGDYDFGELDQRSRLLIGFEDGKLVTFDCPTLLLYFPSPFIAKLPIRRNQTYKFVRAIGWLAFVIHVVSIGMADLVTQIYTVALLVVPSVLTAYKFGCEDSEVKVSKYLRLGRQDAPAESHCGGCEEINASQFAESYSCMVTSRLRLVIRQWPLAYELRQSDMSENGGWIAEAPSRYQDRTQSRQDLFAWLQLSTDEEESMDKWDLLPHIREAGEANTAWWERYKHKKRAVGQAVAKFGRQTADQKNAIIRFNCSRRRTDTGNFIPQSQKDWADEDSPQKASGRRTAVSRESIGPSV
ncbi:hypothetical protein H2200_006009 [Cladophialophora chaetospira]|uniref:Uncharacterized protein n=1 Tax=Cladophialophora chaetospira TaxID=386627 RepID=A0AA38XAC9_9EURO|nr:hypothetical protein H2200_006009 [Cladophialophora chaetospira]